MLANGVTKSRADRNGNAKAATYFTVLAQSTGEMGLEAKLAEKKLQAKGGQLIRMAELDADRGKGLNTFDVLNINPDSRERFATGIEQAEYLKKHARENCGVIIDSFLKAVVSNVEHYKAMLKEAKLKWLERKLTGDEGVEVARMAKRFSTIFASGIIAVELGIIPHSFEEVENCVDIMFTNWLDRFGGDVPYEFKTMVADLYKLCIENQHLRFCNSSDGEKQVFIKDKAGYFVEEAELISSVMNEYGEEEKKYRYTLKEFWFYPKVFEREVLKGRDKKAFFPLLVKNGYIEKGTDGNYTQMKRPAREMSQRFIVIPASPFYDVGDLGENE